MKPSIDALLMEIDMFEDMIRFYGNDDVGNEDRQVLAKKLALLTEKIRVKFGLTSAYYFSAECHAKQMVHDLYGEEIK